MQVIVETGRAVGTEGLVAGQVVDIKSEGKQRTVREMDAFALRPSLHNTQ